MEEIEDSETVKSIFKAAFEERQAWVDNEMKVKRETLLKGSEERTERNKEVNEMANEIKKEFGETFCSQLEIMENELWHFESLELGPIGFNDRAIRATCKLFSAMIFELVYLRSPKEDSRDVIMNRAAQAGIDIRRLIYKYTGIETTKMYDDIMKDKNGNKEREDQDINKKGNGPRE